MPPHALPCCLRLLALLPAHNIASGRHQAGQAGVDCVQVRVSRRPAGKEQQVTIIIMIIIPACDMAVDALASEKLEFSDLTLPDAE